MTMRIRLAMAVTGAVVVALIACGIDIPEVVPVDAGVSEAGATDAPLLNDAAKDAGADVITPPVCDAACGFALPQGFGLVTFSAGATPACDPGQAPSDVVVDPKVGASACTCPCTITKPPDCSRGIIKTTLDNDNSKTCGITGVSLVATPGCNVQVGNLSADIGVTAPSAIDAGGCSTNLVVDNTALQSNNARVCTPSSCATTSCVPSLGRLCAVATGDVGCPSPFTEKHLMGTSAAVACSPCGSCSIAAACAGTLDVFMNGACSVNELVGKYTTGAGCQPTLANGVAIGSFKWTGFGTSSCTADASTPSANLTNAQTVCCRPGM